MPADVYRESRESRYYRDDSPSDDDRYRRTTVHRYKVKSPSSHAERIERYERTEEIDDDRRSRYSAHVGRPSGDLVDPERPYAPDRSQSVGAERTIEVYHEREADRARPTNMMYEKDIEREREWDRQPTGKWKYKEGDAEIEVEKRVDRQPDGDTVALRRVEEHRDLPRGEMDWYRKETEFYSAPDPLPVPVVIRQQAPEQRIIFQEAPPPAPIILRDERRDPRDDEYYYHKDYALAAYDRRDRRHEREYGSDAESDGELYYRRTVITRNRSGSEHHHKRHIAEGALAGAGAAALLASRHNKEGYLPENRGRKVVAGAALGALGTEAVRRARSAFEDRRSPSSSRSRSRSRDRHNKIKTGLGIAAAALAVAGAAKYYQSTKIDKEESSRGRPRRRDSYSDEYYEDNPHTSSSRSRSRKRSSSVAKMGLGAAAAAGIVEHMRNKSREREGKRSRSRIKTGAEIAAATLAGAGVGKMMDKRKERKSKSKSRSRSTSISSAPDEYYETKRRGSRSRSRSRSAPPPRTRVPHSPESVAADRELDLVEYGRGPLHPTVPYPDYTTDDERLYRGGDEYDSTSRESRRHRRHKHRRQPRHRDRSAHSSSEEDREKKKRNHSRLRNLAAAGAAAFGLKKAYDKGKEKKEEDQEQEERERHKEERRAARRARRSRERERGRYADSTDSVDQEETDHVHSRPTSPPHASGGAYYPPRDDRAPPMASGGSSGFVQHDNKSTVDLGQYPDAPPPGPAYNDPPPPPPPAGATYGPHPPDGYVPPPFPMNTNLPPAGPPPPPSGPPPPGDQVSGMPRHQYFDHGPLPLRSGPGSHSAGDEVSAPVNKHSSAPSTPLGSRPSTPPSPPTKSVQFGPLSPRSSATLLRRRQKEQEEAELDGHDERPQAKGRISSSEVVPYHSHEPGDSPRGSRLRQRRSSDPSSDRPTGLRRRAGRDSSPDSDADVEELPSRFDDQGRPINRPRFASRTGSWEYNDPSGRGHSRGAWAIGGGGLGENAEVVGKVIKEVADVIEGKNSWLGLVTNVLGGGLLELRDDHSDRHRRALSDRGRRRLHGRHDDNNDGDGEPSSSFDSERRSRRRRRRDDDERDDDDDDDRERGFGHRRRLSLDGIVEYGSGAWDGDGGDSKGKRKRKTRN